MFGLGYQELLIILVIVLVLFGANRLPELAKSLGSSVKEFKKGVNEAKAEDTAAALRRTTRRRPSSPALSPRADPRSRCILHSRHARPCRPVTTSAPRVSRSSPSSRACPYRARMLYNWDAVQFALALGEYDVVKHQPHPPGLHPVRRRWAALVNGWLGDAAAAYVALAVAFSGLTTFVVYLLARAMYDRPTALAAATLLAVSPLFWFYGSVGLTYAGEALFASIVAYFALPRSERQRDRRLAGAPAISAWPGGIRQSLLASACSRCGSAAVVLGVRRPRVVLVGLGDPDGRRARLVRADDLAHRRTRARTSRPRASWPTRWSSRPRSSAAPSRSPCACRATCWSRSSSRSARWPSAVLLVPWYVAPPRLGHARSGSSLAVDGAAGARLHAGAFRAGGLRADVPARARHPPVARAAGGARAASRALPPPARRARRSPPPRWSCSSSSSTAPSSCSARPAAARLRHRAGRRGARRPSDEAFDWIFSRTAAALREHEESSATFVEPDPRTLPARRHRASSPSWATRARTRGCVTRCSTCRSTRSTSCTSATARPGYYAPRGRRR